MKGLSEAKHAVLRKRRKRGSGRPLRNTTRDCVPQFQNWFSQALDQIPGPSRHQRVSKLVQALEDRVGERTIYKYLAGELGASPERLWELGDGLAIAEVPWISGSVAIAAIPRYRTHLLGTVGCFLIDSGPCAQVRNLWNFLRWLLVDPFVPYQWDVDRILETAADNLGTHRDDILVKAGADILLDRRTLELSGDQRDSLRRSFQRWIQTPPKVEEFPEVLHAAFLFEDRNFVEQELTKFVTMAIHQWMERLTHEEEWKALDKRFRSRPFLLMHNFLDDEPAWRTLQRQRTWRPPLTIDFAPGFDKPPAGLTPFEWATAEHNGQRSDDSSEP